MTTTQWIIGLIAAFLGGGAVGAVINQAVTTYRNRRQPIGYKLEVLEIFDRTKVYGSIKAVITVEAEEESNDRVELVVETLSVARLMLVNRGNQDMAEFLFGVSLGNRNEAFRYKETTLDKHHKVICLTPPAPTDLKNELDFKLIPFNRNEEYSIDIYFTYYVPPPDKISLSTPHPIRFVKLGPPSPNVSIMDAAEILVGSRQL